MDRQRNYILEKINGCIDGLDEDDDKLGLLCEAKRIEGMVVLAYDLELLTKVEYFDYMSKLDRYDDYE